ncbi:MAG: hypothetical protein Fues2KO_51210 [Fuerstiella sp.]
MTAASTESPAAIVNISAYKFVRLTELEQRRSQLRDLATQLGIKGTILLSPEGINLFLAAARPSIDEFVAELKQDPQLSDLMPKESISDYQPFNRMLIKIKKEIIAFGIDDVNPIERTSPKLPPKELKAWLDEGRAVHLLDTRNNYEMEIGTFDQAIAADIDHFREFPEAVRKLPEAMKDEPIVMFCTGGIRCEKAGPYMEQAGFKQVFQLDGGILKYFEECGGAHYDGDCFVFDQRVAVDPNLQETQHTQCFVCQEVVSPEDQQSSKYEPGVSCPKCYREPETQIQQQVQDRNKQLRQILRPLPGSQPYFNKRPLNVPERFDGYTLLDFLAEWHPQVDRSEWERKIRESEIVPGQRYGRRKRRMQSAEERPPLSPDRKVRAGERFENLLPGTVEPDVSADIEVIFEDDQFVVINKPAPLPLHPGGRFNRNTLHYILDQLYRPEHPLLVHRLDANTSGVLVLCRKRAVARIVQPQFEQKVVQKEYVAKVYGHPADQFFSCDAPIAQRPAENGLRLIDAEGQAAHTDFEVLSRYDDGTSLLKVTPRTGRTNQIRLHLWHLGHPIVGDPAYLRDGKTGSARTLKIDEPPMCLHARRIQLHDAQGAQREFCAPDPDWVDAEAVV